MPIKYGTTTVSAIKYGSTTVQSVYYGSTRVFPYNVTIRVSNTDTTYGIPFVSTNPQATSGSASITVPFGTTVYFFMTIRLVTGTFPYNLRSNTWTYISGGTSIFDRWTSGAVFRLGVGTCIYTSAINESYNGYICLSGSNGGYTAIQDRDFQIQARTLNCGYYGEVSDMLRWDEDYDYDDYSTIFLRNDYSISIPKATVHGDYYYYMNSTGTEFEDWDFTEGLFPSNKVYFFFRDIYYEGDMTLQFTIYDKDKNYNPVAMSLILDHTA